MKTLLIILFGVPLTFLLLGSSTNFTENSEPLVIDRVMIKTPRHNLPELNQPVVIQIEHQGFPFDINGNFPYVVLIDNQLYRCDKESVREFLERVIVCEPKFNIGRNM